MIPARPLFSHIGQIASPGSGRSWQAIWRDAITDPLELLGLLGLEGQADTLLAGRDTGFRLRVPRGFASRMKRGDARDPLLMQVLPAAAELLETADYTQDPVGDMDARVGPGLLHKYAGRALLIATGSCAIHCRYCFRRHFPYAEETAANGQWRVAIEYLRTSADIDEVILSGGDPLSLATSKLAELTHALTQMPHLRRLRIHTRLPIVLPERVDAELLDWLQNVPLPKVMVLHANHANEIDESVSKACLRLRRAGVSLLNQSVLLRGINDSVDALTGLSERLIACGILPYYLHQLDRVQGAAHFEVSDAQALALIDELEARMPGYLVPRLVREVPGASGKRAVRS